MSEKGRKMKRTGTQRNKGINTNRKRGSNQVKDRLVK